MLAAYNGGPGNTIAWKNLTPNEDPDLFLEIVRIEETRDYIRLINEIHYIYGWLYGEPEER
jgi:soluble lytic murein transglycosylase-like protein